MTMNRPRQGRPAAPCRARTVKPGLHVRPLPERGIPRMKFTIKHKLTSLILITIIPMLLLSTQHYFEMLTRSRQLINTRTQEIAAAVAQDLDHTIEESHNILLPLAQHPAVMAQNSAECDRLFAGLLSSFDDHLNILAAGMNGFNYGSGVDPSSARKLNYSDKEWFQRGSQGAPIVGDLHVSRLFKSPSVMMAAPVFGPDGRQTGVLGFPLNLVKVNERLSSLWKFPSNSSVKVLDSRGNILVDTLHPLSIGTHETDPNIIRDVSLKKTLSEEDTAQDGIRRLYSYAPLTRAPWMVVVGVPSQEAYRVVNVFARKYLTILLLVGFA